MNRSEENNDSKIPQNDPSKAMDSKREVANSPDEKINEDFPGYPHYPSKEDIMDSSTGSHRVDADIENMGFGPNKTGVSERFFDTQDKGAQNTDEAEGESGGTTMAGLDGESDEIGVPHNVANQDLNQNNNTSVTEVDEAAEKGSLNP